MPPGGVWVYWDPDLAQTFEHYGLLEDFPHVVNAAREVNGHDPIDEEELLAKIEDAICDQFPDICSGGKTKVKKYRPLTSSNLANFTRTLMATARQKADGGEVYNPDPTAAASVCASCPMNQKHLCSTCTGLEAVARRLLHAQQTTPLDRALGACSICGCMLRVLVHLHPDVIRRSKAQQELDLYPDHCWIVQDLRLPNDAKE